MCFGRPLTDNMKVAAVFTVNTHQYLYVSYITNVALSFLLLGAQIV